MGDHPERLVSLLKDDRAAVIANAIDYGSAQERDAGLRCELDALAELDIDAEELDLRDYFDRPERLPDDLRRYGLVWLRGGNVFLLRYALAASRADRVLVSLLEQDALVYGGYSAGPCVLGPTLRGFELVDDPNEVDRIYGAKPIWDGLAVLDYVIVPHVDSPEHPETEGCTAVAERLGLDGVPHRTLRDGEAIVVDGPEVSIR
jgi:dipeptidase E